MWPGSICHVARDTGTCTLLAHVEPSRSEAVPVPAANSSLTCVNRTEDKSLPGQARVLTTPNYSRNLNFIVAIWVFVRRAEPHWVGPGASFHADTHMGGL